MDGRGLASGLVAAIIMSSAWLCGVGSSMPRKRTIKVLERPTLWTLLAFARSTLLPVEVERYLLRRSRSFSAMKGQDSGIAETCIMNTFGFCAVRLAARKSRTLSTETWWPK